MSWQDESVHISALENKLGAYLEFISSRQHVERLPEAKDWPVRIKLVHEHQPSASAERVLDAVRSQLAAMQVRFSHESLPAGY
jgi:hypothetical protein